MGVIQKLIINNNNHFLFNSANEMLYKSSVSYTHLTLPTKLEV